MNDIAALASGSCFAIEMKQDKAGMKRQEVMAGGFAAQEGFGSRAAALRWRYAADVSGQTRLFQKEWRTRWE